MTPTIPPERMRAIAASVPASVPHGAIAANAAPAIDTEKARDTFIRLTSSAINCRARKISHDAITEAIKASVQTGTGLDWPAFVGRLHVVVDALAGELNRVRGHNIRAGKGNSLIALSLGDAEVWVEYFYRAPVPGRTWGPPEDCYEDDPGELDLIRVIVEGEEVEPDQFAPDVLATWELAIREAADEAAREGA